MEELVVDYVMRAAALVHKLLPVEIVLSSVLWAFGYALIACLIEYRGQGFDAPQSASCSIARPSARGQTLPVF